MVMCMCRFSFIEGVGLVGFLLLLLLSEVAVISRVPISILCLGLCLVLMSAWTYSCLEWCTFLDWIYGVSSQLWRFCVAVAQFSMYTAGPISFPRLVWYSRGSLPSRLGIFPVAL